MHLNLFIRHCFPQWAKVFSIAQKILDDLSIEDERFSQHLKNIAKIRPKVNPKVKENRIETKRNLFFVSKKDFMTEMISLENGSSRKFLHELSSEPVIYLRKWIGQVNEKLMKTERLSRFTSFSSSSRDKRQFSSIEKRRDFRFFPEDFRRYCEFECRFISLGSIFSCQMESDVSRIHGQSNSLSFTRLFFCCKRLRTNAKSKTTKQKQKRHFSSGFYR